MKQKLQFGEKHAVAFKTGATAILIHRGGHLKSIIDCYNPSPQYFNYMRDVRKISIKDIGKKDRTRTKYVQVSIHLQMVKKYLGEFFDSLVNPQADDSWLDYTEEQQLQMAAMWNKRPENWRRMTA
jgi:hypothetical protein